MEAQSGPCKDQPYNDPKNPKILTFYPTIEEFKDFEKYIDYMESCNAHFGGIAKVIPPKGWKPRKSGYSDLDNKLIEAPILQNVRQTPNRGAYEVRNTEEDSMTVGQLRRFALDKNMVYSFAEEMEEIERNFWKQLTINPPIYGADSCGTLFDEDVQEWNVSNLPSVLQTINEEYGIAIQGVNTPYLYFGMWRAFFGWHTEDMDLYSINYIHDGAAKFWYAIAPHNGRRFERMAASLFPEASKQCAAFLRHKASMISHSVLKSSGIPFNRIMQHEGEFIVTFPHAYHAGFNCGLNVAESTNFATKRWIDYGKYTTICSCQEDNVKIDMGIFIKKYRSEELAAWNDGTERGRHPEDERSSKRPPSSGPSASTGKKSVKRKKTAPDGLTTPPKASEPSRWMDDKKVQMNSSSSHKRAFSESSESGASSSSLPNFMKRSCAGTSSTAMAINRRLDLIMQRDPVMIATDRWQSIPPPLNEDNTISFQFCESVSEGVNRQRGRQTSESSSSSLPRSTNHPTPKQMILPVSPAQDQPVDLRCPPRTHASTFPTSTWMDLNATETLQATPPLSPVTADSKNVNFPKVPSYRQYLSGGHSW